MKEYFVHKGTDAQGNHEVHNEECSKLPTSANRTSLGYHSSCDSAVRKAKIHYDNVDGCYFCSRSCHRQ